MRCLTDLLTRQLVIPKPQRRPGRRGKLKKKEGRRKGKKKCHVLFYEAQLIQTLCLKADTQGYTHEFLPDMMAAGFLPNLILTFFFETPIMEKK